MKPLCTIKKPSGKYLSYQCNIIFCVEMIQAFTLTSQFENFDLYPI
jgi:hypothetical protein